MKFANSLTAVGLAYVSLMSTTAAGMQRMVPKPLDKSVADAFLKCLEETGVEYDINVGIDGSIIVSPIEERELDTAGKDAGLDKCIDLFYMKLKLAVESNRYGNTDKARKSAAQAMTSDELARLGAEGHAAEPYPPNDSLIQAAADNYTADWIGILNMAKLRHLYTSCT